MEKLNEFKDIPTFLNEKQLARKTRNRYGCRMRRVIREGITEENLNEKYTFPECPQNVQSQFLRGIKLVDEWKGWKHGEGTIERHSGRSKKIEDR